MKTYCYTLKQPKPELDPNISAKTLHAPRTL